MMERFANMPLMVNILVLKEKELTIYWKRNPNISIIFYFNFYGYFW
jgi:hypothetical protein